MITIGLEDFEVRLPRALDPAEKDRATALLADAVDEIEDAIIDSGRSPGTWIGISRNRRRAVRVARAMVAQAILIGEDIGKTSWGTTTGPYSDNASYHGEIAVPELWGEVELTDAHLAYLGLVRGGPRWSFPPPLRYPEKPWNEL